MDMTRTLPYIQHVTMHMLVYRGSLERICEFVCFDMRDDDPPPPDMLANFLRRKSTQDLLERKWSTAIWRGIAGDWRLIALTTSDDPEICRSRIDSYPKSSTQCRFCQIEENQFAQYELEAELDLNNKPVHRSMLHPRCRLSWLRLRATASLEKQQ